MADTNTTTYELPNYTGQLFQRGQQRPNTTLQLLGGITGYQTTTSTEFAVGQEYDVPDHKASTARLEGGNAPDATGAGRSQTTNVVQIWHETVKVSYTKEAASGQLSGLNTAGQQNPVASELDFQTGVKLEYIARNLNWTLLNSTYNKPANNAAARRTRGLLQAITTNVVSALSGGNPSDITEGMLEQMMQKLVESGGIADGDTVMCLSNTAQLRKVNGIYKTEFNKTDNVREVGGVRIRSVMTAFGRINFVLEPDLPQDQLVFANFGVMTLVALEIPRKGVLFRELLAKVGAGESYQIYGELGLNHGPEYMHGKITGLTTS